MCEEVVHTCAFFEIEQSLTSRFDCAGRCSAACNPPQLPLLFLETLASRTKECDGSHYNSTAHISQNCSVFSHPKKTTLLLRESCTVLAHNQATRLDSLHPLQSSGCQTTRS